MIQETYDSHPAIRDAAARSITGHAAEVGKIIEAARRRYAPAADWSAASLALYTQAVLQGAFILAKAGGGPKAAADSVDHLRRYITLLFNRKGA
jgi:TetR/AcrR family transcriptional repressor of nem operon